jgi:hypothetical protein
MSQPPTQPIRLAGLGLALVAAVAVLVLQGSQGAALTTLPLRDYVEYWAAGQLLAEGNNPYDPELIQELERQAGRDEDGILMWNPPWALPLVLPLGMLPLRTGHLVWLLLNLVLIAVCADTLWRIYGGPSSRRLVALLLACTFMPAYFALIVGQISPFLLVGAVAFLVLVRQGYDLAAGAATVLLAVKPHLAYLFWLALLLWTIRERRWRILAGGVLAATGLTAIALAFDPAVLGQYWHTVTTSPPAQYRSPTIGTLIRLALGDGAFQLQFLAMLPGLAWFGVYWWRHRADWSWTERFPLLLLVSILTTAYGGWAFDLVLLVVPVMQIAARLAGQVSRRLRLAGLAAYILFNILALAMVLSDVEYLGFIWMTPALLVAYLAFRHAPRYEPATGASAA